MGVLVAMALAAPVLLIAFVLIARRLGERRWWLSLAALGGITAGQAGAVLVMDDVGFCGFERQHELLWTAAALAPSTTAGPALLAAALIHPQHAVWLRCSTYYDAIT